MAIAGLLLSIYVVFELKKPADPTKETMMVEYFNENMHHEYLTKIFGEGILEKFTIYQVCKYLKDVVW
jgi:hypothetical protein